MHLLITLKIQLDKAALGVIHWKLFFSGWISDQIKFLQLGKTVPFEFHISLYF